MRQTTCTLSILAQVEEMWDLKKRPIKFNVTFVRFGLATSDWRGVLTSSANVVPWPSLERKSTWGWPHQKKKKKKELSSFAIMTNNGRLRKGKSLHCHRCLSPLNMCNQDQDSRCFWPPEQDLWPSTTTAMVMTITVITPERTEYLLLECSLNQVIGRTFKKRTEPILERWPSSSCWHNLPAPTVVGIAPNKTWWQRAGCSRFRALLCPTGRIFFSSIVKTKQTVHLNSMLSKKVEICINRELGNLGFRIKNIENSQIAHIFVQLDEIQFWIWEVFWSTSKCKIMIRDWFDFSYSFC